VNIFMLTDKELRDEATYKSTYQRGCEYYQAGKVQSIKFNPDKKIFSATVMGSKLYNIKAYFDEDKELDEYACDCPAFRSYDGMCKHVIAALKSVQKNWTTYFNDNETKPSSLNSVNGTAAITLTKERGVPNNRLTPSKKNNEKLVLNYATKELLEFFTKDMMVPREYQPSEPIKLIPTYAFSNIAGKMKNWLEFAIGDERMYVVKDIPQLMRALENKQQITYGKKFTLKPQEHFFDEQSIVLLDFVQSIYNDEKQLANWGYGGSYTSVFGEPRHLKLTNTTIRKFFDIMGDSTFSLVSNNQKNHPVKMVEGRPLVNVSVKNRVGGLKIDMQAGNHFFGLDTNCHYIYYNGIVYKVDPEFSNYLKPLLRCFALNGKPEVHIPSTEIPNFFATMLPSLEKIGKVKVDQSLFDNCYKEQLEMQVYFDRFGEGMSAGITFKYGKFLINGIGETSKLTEDSKGKMLLRSTGEENKLISLFRRYGFRKLAGKFVQDNEEQSYNFLQTGLPELRDIAEIFYSDDFKDVKIQHTGKISAGVKISSKSGMLELSLDYEDIQPDELFELLSSYKLKKRYHRLQNGAFIPLDSADFQMAANLMEQLGLNASDIENKIIELPKHRAMYIDSLTRENSEFNMQRSSAFKKMVQDIREPQDVEVSIPEGIQGKLRGYQTTGFKWLKSLASYGFGGILADDMGLGKTLQVITFIMSEKLAEDSRPSLVIVPTSLVYNWQQEVQKFAPDLKVALVAGNPSERQEQIKDIDAADLVVTSYALIKRDIKFYEDRTFKYCFIDEAQHIKNPNTLSAKSVKKIKATGYFALTGTPIENTLTELWSIFDFLMPGYLHSHQSFSKKFETPIVKNQDKQAMIELGRYIKPFILRRMKKTVLKELPEKIESKMINEMTPEQTKLYIAWMQQAKQEFATEIQSNGFAKSQIKILSLLTRLRQVCCHPSLFIENYNGGSGKLEMLTELIEDAVAGRHRILLFSQFTGMLAIIKEELAARKIEYHYLDGSTKSEERIDLVNSFNAGEKAIFLISLKAGGTGLNLTGADMVIHYDPWWNPAVEDQATDRAHRIGQKNAVQVFRFITKNTIEEKIYDLQQKKRELIDALIQPGENFLTKMSEEEIRKLFED